MLKIIFTITFLLIVAAVGKAQAQATEDQSLNPKPTIKIESLSPAGHCDNQQLSFFAPWADHYEIIKRRSDTAWIRDNKSIAIWSSQPLKPGVNGMIYKKLDEQGSYQFVVKAYKGDKYRLSDTITIYPCIPPPQQK